MSSVPFESLPEDQQKFLEEVRVKMQALYDAKVEILKFIDERTDWQKGDMSQMRGDISCADVGIYQYDFGYENKQINIEDFWYASDQDC